MNQMVLRDFTASDVDRRQAVGLHAEIQRLLGVDGETRPMTDEEARSWGYPTDGRHRWMIEVDGDLIGQVTLRMLSEPNRLGRLGISLFEPRWLGRGFGTEALRRVLEELFDDSAGPSVLHRADLRVLASNVRAQASYRKLGFRQEGVERETCWFEGRWHDDWIMGVLEQERRSRRPGSASR